MSEVNINFESRKTRMRRHREWLVKGGHFKRRKRFPRRIHQERELRLLPLWAKATLVTILKCGPQKRRARLHLTRARVATLRTLGLVREAGNLIYLTELGKSLARKIPWKAGREGGPRTHRDKSGQSPPQALDLENPDASRYVGEKNRGVWQPAVIADQRRPQQSGKTMI